MAIISVKMTKRHKGKELEAGIYGYITFKVTDHGRVIFRRKRQMHSLTGLWLLDMGNAWSRIAYTLTAYSPNSFVVNTSASPSACTEGFFIVASSPYVGIVVGTGQKTKAPNDFTLASPVTSSSTGLSYGELSMLSPTVSGNTSTLSMQRAFTNMSSSPITLTEAAIVVYASAVGSTSPDFDVALAYDYISPSITLSEGQNLTITYQMQVTM